jgi:O-antigen/teichoic acid export membrane protein
VQGRARRWSELVSSLQSAPITEYKPFSGKLPAAFTGVGGALTIAGGLGVWIRLTVNQGAARAPEEVRRVMGYDDRMGLVIAAFGFLAIIASGAWYMKSFLPKLIPVGCTAVIVSTLVRQFPVVREQYQNMVKAAVAAAEKSASSGIYHAGFGWGAWLALAGGLLLILGAITGLLREMDIGRERKRVLQT